MSLPTIPNITIELVEEGNFPFYRIAPNEGYIMHDKVLDVEETDERDNPTGKIILGYYPSSRTCLTNYDFENVKEINGHVAYGEREFFARLASEISTEGGEHDV